MLNLSDKELDRFSKEAAQEYEPGDVLGERAWEKLEVHLDRDLGRVSPNPLRHIRRFPFYYAPALLVLLGVSYYMMRRSSGGSPPSRTVKASAAVVQHPSSSQSPVYKEKSTPTSSAAAASSSDSASAGVDGGGVSGAGAGAAGSSGAGSAGSAAGSVGAGSARSATGSSSAGSADKTVAGSSAGARAVGTAAAGTGSAGTGSARPALTGAAGRNSTAGSAGAGTARVPGSAGVTGSARVTGAVRADGSTGSTGSAGGHVGNGIRAAAGISGSAAGNVRNRHGNHSRSRRQAKDDDVQEVTASMTAGVNTNTAQAQPKELSWTTLQGLRPTKKAPYVNDSALRAFTLKSTAPQLVRNRGVHVNRSLTLGVVLAPDFASVNALAGDRPGSTIGLTADYQFAHHLYIGSGLLLDRKIFAARGQDFHASQQFYQSNGLRDVYSIKGTFEMLEIPLNLRYDFSTTGSTLFFISSGLSSYLLTSENNNYYYVDPMRRLSLCTSVSSPTKSYLFSALNLSVGVETGISNSLSLLIAPYMKIPTRGVGIGQVQMNTVGIDFSLRFAPVISRKRY